jgi:hypothetical protein
MFDGQGVNDPFNGATAHKLAHDPVNVENKTIVVRKPIVCNSDVFGQATSRSLGSSFTDSRLLRDFPPRAPLRPQKRHFLESTANRGLPRRSVHLLEAFREEPDNGARHG